MTIQRFSLVTEGTAALGFADLEKRLAATGASDVELRRPTGGNWVVDVAREADTFRDAVLPAIDAVTAAGITVSHVTLDWGG